MHPLTCTKQEFRRYLVRYHHLTGETALKNKEGIRQYFEKVRTIQYDPLNVVGRNPDLVLFSRIHDYERQYLNDIMYTDFSIIDHWDKNMSLVLADDWLDFNWSRARYSDWYQDNQAHCDEILRFIDTHGPVTSSTLDLNDSNKKIDWYYGPTRQSKAFLEGLFYCGKLIIAKKAGNRKHYDLTEKHLKTTHLQPLHPIDTAKNTASSTSIHYIYRRILATGALWNRPSDALLGKQGMTKATRDQAFSILQKEGHIQAVHIDGIEHPIYIPNTQVAQFIDNIGAIETPVLRFIAPLDNMIWDRKFIEALFGFQYTWEVYMPESQRKYGYYVLPMLFGSEFVGRIEFDHYSKQKHVLIKNIWWENKANTAYKAALNQELKRLEKYLKYSFG